MTQIPEQKGLEMNRSRKCKTAILPYFWVLDCANMGLRAREDHERYDLSMLQADELEPTSLSSIMHHELGRWFNDDAVDGWTATSSDGWTAASSDACWGPSPTANPEADH